MIKEILVQIVYSVKHFFKVNLKYISQIIVFSTPYFCMWLAYQSYQSNRPLLSWLNVLLPVVLFTMAGVVSLAAKTAKNGKSMPIPRKRFTQCDNCSNLVFVDPSEWHEMLVYMAELEDWLEFTGKLRK